MILNKYPWYFTNKFIPGIHVPVRVEPKVALATERTFLSWLEFSIILGSIAVALVNFSAPIDGSSNPSPPPSPIVPNQQVFQVYSANSTVPITNTGFPITMVSALAFTIIALLALLYSLGLYIWRVDRINKRVSVNYHDWFGPSALCLGLFGAVLVNFGFRLFGWGEGAEFKG